MPPIDYFRTAEETQSFEAGAVIFDQGDVGEAMYAVRSGQVAIVLNGQELEVLAEGGLFGEMALIDKATRSAQAVAKTDCVVVPVDKNRFLYLVHETPTFALQVMQIMSERLRRLNNRM